MERAGKWELRDAKARFSELVRRARNEGPQTVTVRGKEAIVVMSANDYARLQPTLPKQPLLGFLKSVDLSGLDLTREPDYGRDVEL